MAPSSQGLEPPTNPGRFNRHTLTELWSVGLPALVFDFPTVANRVRENGAGWVLSDHRDIPRLYDEILRIAFDTAEQARSDLALMTWQSDNGTGGTTRMMAAEYFDVYRAARRRARERHGVSVEAPGKAGSPAAASRAARSAPVVAVVCPAEKSLSRANASTEVRIWQRTRNALDREVTYVRMTPASLLANLRAGRIDGAILQRTAIPVTLVQELLAAFGAAKVPYLFDLDDDLLNVPGEKDSGGVYAQYAPALRDLVAHASVLTVSTPALLQSYRALNSRAVLLANRLSRALWAGPPQSRSADGVSRALYMGRPTHQDDFRLIRAALGAAAATNPTFRLGIIGVTTEDLPPWAERIEVPPAARTYSRFVPWLRAQSRRFDFAIAPLEETTFNANKSPLKILEYGALGLPVLASDTVVYRELAMAAPGVTPVTNQTGEWKTMLHGQIDLGARNAELGAELRQWIFENHILEPTLPDFDALVQDMLAENI